MQLYWRRELHWVAPHYHWGKSTHQNIHKHGEYSLFLSVCLYWSCAFEQPHGCIPLHPEGWAEAGMVSKKAERGLCVWVCMCVIQINSGLGRSKRSLITSVDGSDLRGNANQIALEIPRRSLCSKSPSSEGMCANISTQLPALPHTQLPFRESRQKSAEKKERQTQRLMAALPAAWGLTHINMSGGVGAEETARRNGDEEREIEGENKE